MSREKHNQDVFDLITTLETNTITWIKQGYYSVALDAAKRLQQVAHGLWVVMSNDELEGALFYGSWESLVKNYHE